MARSWITGDEPLPFDVVPVASIFVLSIAALFWAIYPYRRQRGIPIINDKKRWALSYASAKRQFQYGAPHLIKAGFEKSANAFRLISDIGPVLVLSPKYAREIRNDDRLNLVKFTIKEFHSNIPGFEPIKMIESEPKPLGDVIKINLTQGLAPFIEPLAHEASNALSANWADSLEWQEHTLKPSILNIVAQLSSKLFVGDSLCRNPEWQKITITYTVNLYIAAHALALWPRVLRPLVHWFLPSCRILRKQIRDARNMINPIITQRRAFLDQGQMSANASVLGWLEQNYQGERYDPAIAQIFLSFAAIHSTSDLLTQVIYDICGEKDLIDDLRNEIVSTLQESGWTKATLHNLKLMDSVLKESQRLKPVRLFSMGRVADTTIDLADGLQIPKGTSVMVSNHGMWDGDIYPDHETFDGYRFLKMRQLPGQERYCQLVSSTPSHMGFGYGKHACPGRFFAVTEIKIALCIMLLKYDFKYDGEGRPEKLSYGFNLLPSPEGKIWIRRREEETALTL